MNIRPKLYVDMDGTLAVFNNNISSEDELYEKGYFRNSAPQQNVVDAVRILANDENLDVFILSAYLGDSKYALYEKDEWLNEYLPEIEDHHRLFVKCGEEKKNAIEGIIDKHHWLLDDYTKNLNEWDPGSGIKLLNGINHTKGTWQGHKVSHEMDGETLAGKIKDIVFKERRLALRRTRREMER